VTEAALAGSLVALPTPFRDGALDLEALEELVDEHARRGTAGVVVAGTTGEAPALERRERAELLAAALSAAAERLAVVAGVGTNATRETVELARAAERGGAHALLVVTPYYVRPQQEGLVQHFGAVAEAFELPLVLYEVPSRTGVELAVESAARIAETWPNAVALKSAVRDLAKVERLVRETPLSILCGEDALLADFAQRGAAGAVSVVGNLAPEAVVELLRAAQPGGEPERAAALVEELAPLVSALFVETNPVPLKAMLARLGRCRPDVRLPLAPLSVASAARVEEALAAAGLVAAA
jgi:4-hydroxy-tetrahydrodipicolinate synthase